MIKRHAGSRLVGRGSGDVIAYLGTVRVRHSLIGMDIAGSVLAVLVDRPVRSDYPAGIPQRGIDWYDIGDVEFPDTASH